MRSEICDMYISLDVLCCTASILHLVAISVDRYWAVTNIDYIRSRTAKRILIMIAAVWFIAMSISIPPLFGWKDGNDPAVTGICLISQDYGYTIFSTVGAFYLPTILMLIIYAKIFSVARQRIHRKRFVQGKNSAAKSVAEKVTKMTNLSVPRESPLSRSEISEMPNGNGSSSSAEHDDNENKFKTNGHVDDATTAMLPKTDNEVLKAKRQKEKLEMKRERKAARTLVIITGAFIICWLPFFIIAVIRPFIQKKVPIPPLAESITLWLGYCNSLLNPIIYTIFNPEFRAAFQKILFGKYGRKYRQNKSRSNCR